MKINEEIRSRRKELGLTQEQMLPGLLAGLKNRRNAGLFKRRGRIYPDFK